MWLESLFIYLFIKKPEQIKLNIRNWNTIWYVKFVFAWFKSKVFIIKYK